MSRLHKNLQLRICKRLANIQIQIPVLYIPHSMVLAQFDEYWSLTAGVSSTLPLLKQNVNYYYYSINTLIP